MVQEYELRLCKKWLAARLAAYNWALVAMYGIVGMSVAGAYLYLGLVHCYITVGFAVALIAILLSGLMAFETEFQECLDLCRHGHDGEGICS